jgi:hypothetical protein
MRNDRAKPAQIGDADSGGWMSRLLAEEDEFDRAALWRFGSWGAAAVCAVASAMMVTHYTSGRERVRTAEISRHTQQLQEIAREAKTENRRLAAAIDTLNSDRDRLFARVTGVEQSLDSVTGALAKPSSAAAAVTAIAWPKASAAPIIGTPATVASAAPVPAATPATLEPEAPSKAPDKPAPQPLDDARADPIAVAALTPSKPAAETAVAETIVRPVEFGLDLGSANSVEGLRAIWRGALKKVPDLIGSLQPMIAVREGHNGLGLRLHLLAGPLNDAAAAAKLCASLIASHHRCETALFEGQRLALEPPAGARISREKTRRPARSHARPQAEKRVEEASPQQQPQPQPVPEPAQSRGFSAIFNR